jgi:hypothetical protein
VFGDRRLIRPRVDVLGRRHCYPRVLFSIRLQSVDAKLQLRRSLAQWIVLLPEAKVLAEQVAVEELYARC